MTATPRSVGLLGRFLVGYVASEYWRSVCVRLDGLFAVALAVVLVGPNLAWAQAAPDKQYEVTGFTLTYAQAHPRLPAIEQVAALSVPLAESGGVIVATGGTPRVVALNQSLPAGTNFSAAALRAVLNAIVIDLNRRGLYGVYVKPAREQIDPQSGDDLRPAGSRNLTLVIWTSRIAKVRTIARGDRFARVSDPVNYPAHDRLREHSPLHAGDAGAPGDLLEKAKLDDYLRRLNRQPGRNVEASISASDEPGQVVLDYLVSENKPWYVYGQVSNTGTAATARLRERVGATDTQLFNRDDIASLDYITSNFTKANAVFGSYSLPVVFPDKLRLRAYGSWGDFEASVNTVLTNTSGVAVPPDRFSGGSWEGGAEAIASPWPLGKFALDFAAGIAFEHVDVNNKTLAQTGKADLTLPYVSCRIERISEVYSLTGSLGYETNLSTTDSTQLVRLGRLDTNDSYDMLKADFAASTFLEPIFFGIGSDNKWNRSTLAHEIAISFHGQYVFGSNRLIPQKEDAVGGFFSVRGYPDSVVSGDRVYTGTAEYRFHIPRALRPSSAPADGVASAQRKEEATDTLFGRRFNYRPPRPYSRPDWDLIARAFVDAGYTEVNLGTQPRRPEDHNQSLLGTGVGLELQVWSNFNFRADVGWALDGLKTGTNSTTGYVPGPNDVKQGSVRAHLLATVIW